MLCGAFPFKSTNGASPSSGDGVVSISSLLEAKFALYMLFLLGCLLPQLGKVHPNFVHARHFRAKPSVRPSVKSINEKIWF